MSNGLSPRDIDLIFKANTRGAARDVNTLGDAIGSLRSQIKQQTSEADKGIDTTEALKASYKELTSALSEVKDNYSLLTKVQGEQSKEDAQKARVAALTKTYDELAAKLAAAAKPSAAFQDRVDRASRSVQNAQTKLEQMQAATVRAAQAFEQAGGDVNNLSKSQELLVNQTKEIARGVNEVEAALDGYSTKATQASVAALKLSESQKFDTLAAGSGLPTAQIEYIKQQADSYKLLEAAIKETTTAKKQFDQAVESQASKIAADTARSLATNLDAVEAAETRLAQNRAFATIANDSIQAANNQVRFKSSLDGSAVSAVKLADAIRALVNPSSDALKSIQGVSEQVDRSAETLNSPKALRTSQYQEASNTASQAGAAAGRLAGQIDDFKAQQEVVDATTEAFKRQQAAVLDAAHALQVNENATQEDVRELRDLESGLEKTGNALKVAETRLIAMDAALKKAGVDTSALATEETRLTAIATKAGATLEGLNKKTGATGSGGFLGLKPYELQNLSYQVNDVVTGLASGQRPLQVLAQQGGQVAQIFPGFTTALIANAGALAGVAAAALVAYAAYKHLAEGAQASRDANEILARSGEVASGTTAPGLAKASIALQDLGVKAADAKKAMQDLVNEGFNSDRIQAFIPLAQGVASLTGDDIPAALGKLGTAFGGGYDQVAKFDDELNFLTQDQRTHIRALFDQGDATNGVKEALDALTAKVEAARQPTNELTQLFHNLKGVFDDIVDSSGIGGFFSNLSSFLHDSGVEANYLLLRLRGVNAEIAAKAATEGKTPEQVQTEDANGPVKNTKDISGNYLRYRQDGYDVKTAAKAASQGITPQQVQQAAAGPPQTTKAGKDYLEDQKRQLAAETDIGDATKRTTQLAAIKAKALQDAADHGVRGADAEALADARVNAEKDKYAKKDAETAKTAQNQREAAARRAEALQKKIADEATSLSKSLGDITAQAGKGGAESLQKQLDAAASGVKETLDGLIAKAEEFRKLTNGKGLIGGQTIDQYEAALKVQGEILANEKQLAVYEQNVNDLVKARDEELQAIQNRVKNGQQDPGAALKEAEEVTSRYQPLIAGAAKAGTDFANGIKTGIDSAALNKAKVGFGTAIDSGDQANKKQAQADIAEGERKLNDIIEARNSIVSTYNALVEEGFMSQSQADATIAEAYKQTTPLINEQVKALQELIDKLVELKAISPQAAEALRAGLKKTSAETQHVTELQKNLRTAVNQSITKDAVATINNVAKALANVAIHGGKVSSVFESIGEGLLMMLADVLMTIAQLILEAVILNAVDKATGGILKPLLKLTANLGVHHAGTDDVGAGGSGRRRSISISPEAIAAAPRYHSGTSGVGLSANETLAVLEKGEAVIPEDSPDHPANRGQGGNGSGKADSIRQVLVLGDDEVAGAMAGAHGEKTVLTHIRRNATTIKQILQ